MAMYSTTASFFRLNPPSGGAYASNIAITIQGTYACGTHEVTPLLRPWTHVAEVPVSVAVKDSYPGQAGSWLLGNTDTVRLPPISAHGEVSNQDYIVIFNEKIVNSDGTTVKRLYLDRLAMP